MIISHGAKKVSLYNPDTGTVVQLNSLDADAFEFEQREVETDETDPTGGSYFGGDYSRMFVRFIDPDGSLYNQLKTWREDGTRISAVMAGAHKNVQWYERDRISTLRPVPITGRRRGRADMYEVELVRDGHGSHDIHGQVNLLAHLGWEDADNGGLADNYAVAASVNSTSFNSSTDTQVMTTGASGTAVVTSPTVVFPVAGVPLTLSSEAVSLHTDQDELAINTRDASDILIAQTTRSISATGRNSMGITTPSNIFGLDAHVLRVSNVSVSETAEARYPALRTDGSSEYVSY